MKLLELTLSSAAENVALDEAMLNEAESGQQDSDVLRIWEPDQTAVVIGRSSRVDQEVCRSYCRANGIPIVRRCSGGAAVVASPGCLMYAVVLSIERNPHLRTVDYAHQFVLRRIQAALRMLQLETELRGFSDLTYRGRKFSGNSLRCRRKSLLYHGTLLYESDLSAIQECLRMPPRQPEYRCGRTHADFLCNLNLPAKPLREAIAAAWDIDGPLPDWPSVGTRQLVCERYSLKAWNESR